MKRKLFAVILVAVMMFSVCSCTNIAKSYLGYISSLAGDSTSGPSTGKSGFEGAKATFSLAGGKSSASSSKSSASSKATSASQSSAAIKLSKQEVVDYFCEIALKSAYGSTDTGIVRRWEQAVKVEIIGEYTKEDYNWLVAHINNLNKITGMQKISVVTSNGNYKVYFKTLAQLPSVIPGYVDGNWGFINITWNASQQILSGTMGIATDVTNQLQRNHLILEEFTQGLGLLNDSSKYTDSIYYIKWTETQSLTNLDLMLVRMLYSSAVKAGMKESAARTNLASWLGTNG